MAREPYLPLFFGDLLASTAMWDGEERALYILLLAYQWTGGPLPADQRRLVRMTQYDPKTFAALWVTVGKKFVTTEDGLVNLRLEEHRTKTQQIAAARSQVGRVGGQASAQAKAQAKVEAKPQANGQANGSDLLEQNSTIYSNPIQSNPDQPNPTPQNREGEAAIAAPPPKANGHTKSRKSPLVPLPEDFALTPELEQYAIDHLPGVDPKALIESFRGKAMAKDWRYANWRQAFQEFIRNASPTSGHWAAGQYPKAAEGARQWQ